ncbi:TlpA family protein disulfide reductase [Ectothiorhodospiraceae bacterium 2226]|nr:TlpA family protein disulfide reductase [Ectothiorhodospiraceae bacterium 2226]
MRAFLLAVMVALAGAWHGAAAAEAALPPGVIALEEPRPAPSLRLSDMDGNDYDLQEARGRWAFVHFWASWCGPCRRELPALERMVAALEGEPLEIVMINTAEDDDTVWTFLGGVAPELLDTLMDYDGLVTEDWQPRGLPATYLVDPRGQVRYQVLGGREWDTAPYLAFLRSLSN